MSSRDRTQDDLELETLIDLFDTALTSNNPAMKKAVKNLLLVATLIDSELSPEQRVRGPLRQALEDMRDLTRRMDRIEMEHRNQNNPYTYPAPYTPIPGTPWPNPNVTTPWTIPPGTTIGTSTSSSKYSVPPNQGPYSINSKITVSSTAFDDQFRAEELLTKLESK
jgi:hypothetical protein